MENKSLSMAINTLDNILKANLMGKANTSGRMEIIMMVVLRTD